MTGDFNICSINEANKNSTDFMNLMHSNYIHPLINKPTRVTQISAFLIHHTWSNNPAGTSSGIIVLDVTDHYPIFTN